VPSQACGMLLANNSINLTPHLLSGLNTRSEICVSLITFEGYFYELQDLCPEETKFMEISKILFLKLLSSI
jgi:hypothetical protein